MPANPIQQRFVAAQEMCRYPGGYRELTDLQKAKALMCAMIGAAAPLLNTRPDGQDAIAMVFDVALMIYDEWGRDNENPAIRALVHEVMLVLDPDYATNHAR